MATSDVFSLIRNLPLRMMGLLFLSFVGNACAFSAFFGYLPTLIHHFGVEWEIVGFYQGSILFLYLTTYSVSAFVSGKLLDKYGSRYLFLISTFLQSFVLFFSAFTTSMSWLYANTVLMALSTTRVVSLTLVYEICDEANQPYIMTYAQSMPWNIGMFLGPTLAGTLAFPTEQYPNLFDESSVLAKFPIMLPCCVIGATMFATALIGWFILLVPIVPQYHRIDVKSTGDNNFEKVNSSDGLTNTNTSEWSLKEYCKFLTSKNAITTMFALLILGLTTEMFLTLFSVFIMTPTESGGAGYSPKSFGLLSLIGGCLVIPTDMFIPSQVLKIVGYRKGLSLFFTLKGLIVALSWMPSRISTYGISFALFTAALVVARTAVTGQVSAINAITNNQTPSEIRGRILAGQQFIANFLGAAGHALAGCLFAWSLTNISHAEKSNFPFDQVFTFYIIAALTIIGSFCTLYLTEEVERKSI